MPAFRKYKKALSVDVNKKRFNPHKLSERQNSPKMFARKVSLGLIFIAMFYATIAYGDTHQCRHSNGRVELSNIPCPAGSKTEKVIGGTGKQTGMWGTPEGYIGRTDPRWQDRETISPKIYGPGGPEYQPHGSTPKNPSAQNIEVDSATFDPAPYEDSRYPQLYPATADWRIQLKLEEVQQQLQQSEIDREIEKEEQEETARDAEVARQEAEEMAQESIEKAEQAAEELRDEMIRSAVRTKNNFYFGGLLLVIGGFFTYFITKTKREKIMDDKQKYGVVIMIVSFLLILLVVMISDGWSRNLDYLENFMNLLRIRFFYKETHIGIISYDVYLIDVSTKYVVLTFMSTAAYGLTTYLGITPAFKPWKKFFTK